MNDPTHPAPSSQSSVSSETFLERFNFYWEAARLWMTQAWRIGFLMARGAYLTQERRDLFGRLGEDVYYKIKKGELRNTDLSVAVEEIDRLTKKLEISEIKIRSVRFGKRPPRNTPAELKDNSEESL